MKEDEFKAKQIEWDKKSLDKRVERWKQIVPATYNVPLPKLVWGYLSMADDMYIVGNYTPVCSCQQDIIFLEYLRN